MKTAYHRIVLKLSGEALGLDGKLFDHTLIQRTAKVLKQVADSGIQLGIVIGAGNIWRGRQGPSAHMNAVIADQMGMLGTLINCLAMRDALQQEGATCYVQSAIEMERFAQNYNTQLALEHLEKGHIMLFACGSGNPFFSTDTGVALRAVELEADAVLMAKNIDGVYDADPRTNPDAKLIKEITYQEAAAKGLKVCDQAAFTLLAENKVPLLRVFGLEKPESILEVLEGGEQGTFLHP